MGRPSLTNQRREQILEAYVGCVAQFGLHGATQERIAEKAAVKRSILRHYLGNKDQIIDSLVEFVIERYDEQLSLLEDNLPDTGRLKALITYLIAGRSQQDQNLGLCFQALAVHCAQSPRGEALQASMDRFVSLIQREVERASPHAAESEIQAATMVFLSLYLAAESLAPFAAREKWREWAKLAAQEQLESLTGGDL